MKTSLEKKLDEKKSEDDFNEIESFYNISKSYAAPNCKKCKGKGYTGKKKLKFCICAEEKIFKDDTIFCLCCDCSKIIDGENLKVCEACDKPYHVYCYGNNYYCKSCSGA